MASLHVFISLWINSSMPNDGGATWTSYGKAFGSSNSWRTKLWSSIALCQSRSKYARKEHWREENFPIVSRILLFFGTHTDSTVFRYSSGQFFDSRMDSTFSRYSPGFYHISVLTLIRPFFSNRRDSFSILARILSFPRIQHVITINDCLLGL